MCGQPKQSSYKPRGFHSLPGPGPIPALFLLDGVTGIRGKTVAKTPIALLSKRIKPLGKSAVLEGKGWRDKGNDGARQVAVCLPWIGELSNRNTQEEGKRTGGRLRLEVERESVCGRERRDKEVTAAMLQQRVISLEIRL